MKLAWIFALLCTPAVAATLAPNTKDSVYLYEAKGNRNLQCEVYHAYFDTEGYGSFYADHCVETSRDSAIWPTFPRVQIRLSLDFMQKEPRILRNCWFVAHGRMGDSTSTVIDCRN
jgi:hypothetical protein